MPLSAWQAESADKTVSALAVSAWLSISLEETGG